jgi:ribose-phosphate pyrophosphokinase
MITLFGGNKDIPLKWWTFPGGERNVKIEDPLDIERYRSFSVKCNFTCSDDLVDMMLLVNAIRNVNRTTKLRLVIPYFPFARQDRVMTNGEPFALQVVVSMIKSCNFDEVETWDPHSDVLAGMFEAGNLSVRPQWELMHNLILQQNRHSRYNLAHSALVSPDAGALKKIYNLAKLINLPVIEAGKKRDVSTGEIVATTINSPGLDEFAVLYVIDDICDGGRTFIELAKAIKAKGFSGELVLCVTHGIFSKGLTPLECFDKIYTVNNINNADLAWFNKRNKNV